MNLKSRYMRPYLIVEQIGAVAYRQGLLPELSNFHDVFNVSVLRKAVRELELICSSHQVMLKKKITHLANQLRLWITRRNMFKGYDTDSHRFLGMSQDPRADMQDLI